MQRTEKNGKTYLIAALALTALALTVATVAVAQSVAQSGSSISLNTPASFPVDI